MLLVGLLCLAASSPMAVVEWAVDRDLLGKNGFEVED